MAVTTRMILRSGEVGLALFASKRRESGHGKRLSEVKGVPDHFCLSRRP